MLRADGKAIFAIVDAGYDASRSLKITRCGDKFQIRLLRSKLPRCVNFDCFLDPNTVKNLILDNVLVAHDKTGAPITFDSTGEFLHVEYQDEGGTRYFSADFKHADFMELLTRLETS
ncbi:MAG TPA: hypothetical protein VJ835_02015 [Fimbriimonadaceae bacterium]|nr:hypothetical protein [Fimbriimonadaceae bacterium]